MKKTSIFLVVSLCLTSPAIATMLPVPQTTQQQSMWCWAGSFESVFEWLGGAVNQCDLANQLRVANGWGNDQCCNYAVLTLPDQGSICNQGNFIFPGGITPSNWSMTVQDMFRTRNVVTTAFERSFSATESRNEVAAGRPHIMRWEWLDQNDQVTGAHALVLRGEDTLASWFDPWPWNNPINFQQHGWVQYAQHHHRWTRTLQLNQSPNPPIARARVNGASGTYYTNSSTNLNITGQLTDGRYAGAAADWWAAIYFNGYMFYRDQYGIWTTTPTTVSQANLFDKTESLYYGRLAPSTYTVFYGVDLTRNGVLDNPVYYGSVTIVVQ